MANTLTKKHSAKCSSGLCLVSYYWLVLKHLLIETFTPSTSTDADLDSLKFRTHSCRRTAAYYAAWLQVPETTIKVNFYFSPIILICELLQGYPLITDTWEMGFTRVSKLHWSSRHRPPRVARNECRFRRYSQVELKPVWMSCKCVCMTSSRGCFAF